MSFEFESNNQSYFANIEMSRNIEYLYQIVRFLQESLPVVLALLRSVLL